MCVCLCVVLLYVCVCVCVCARACMHVCVCAGVNYADFQSLGNKSDFEKYAIGFYWAVVTTTQVGYGDIVAYTNFEVSKHMHLTACSFSSYVHVHRPAF